MTAVNEIERDARVSIGEYARVLFSNKSGAMANYSRGGRDERDILIFHQVDIN